jgi:hypothetical protein
MAFFYYLIENHVYRKITGYSFRNALPKEVLRVHKHCHRSQAYPKSMSAGAYHLLLQALYKQYRFSTIRGLRDHEDWESPWSGFRPE